MMQRRAHIAAYGSCFGMMNRAGGGKHAADTHAAWDRASITSARHLLCLFYQVEIRYRHLRQKQTVRPIVGSDFRESTMRLWQLRGWSDLS